MESVQIGAVTAEWIFIISEDGWRDEPHGEVRQQRKKLRKRQCTEAGVLLTILAVDRKRWKSLKRIWFSSNLVLRLPFRRTICAPIGSRYCRPPMET